MEHEILKISVEAFLKVYAKDAKEIFDDLYHRGKQFLNNGLKKYLVKHQTKYGEIKTLLHGNTPMNLYDIYYNVKLFNTKTTFIATKKIENIFMSSKGNYLSIIGEAGSGKSTLVQHLFLNTIDTNFGIPIFIQLRDLNDINGDLETYIYQILLEEKIAVDCDIVERILRRGDFVFFLDGFDELHSQVKIQAIKNINKFIDKYSDNKFIITSRPKSDVEYLPRFNNYKIGRLDTLQEIFGFIEKQLSDKRFTDKIIDSIKNSNQTYIFSFLSNPLILSLYILTFESNALIPAKKHIFYQRVIVALFSEHDSKIKMGYLRERYSNLTQEILEDILGVYCLFTFFENKYEWDADYIRKIIESVKLTDPFKSYSFNSSSFTKDMSLGLSLWLEDSGIYSFPHRTIQEFYVAKFIANLKPAENKKFYDLLIKKYILSNNHPYLHSLLSFLDEMDTYNMKINFTLPLLKNLQQILKIRNMDQKIGDYLGYFGYFTLGSKIVKRKFATMPIAIEKFIPGIKAAKDKLSSIETVFNYENVYDEFNLAFEIDLHSKKIIENDSPARTSLKDHSPTKLKILTQIKELSIKVKNEISSIEQYLSNTQQNQDDILKILSTNHSHVIR